MWTSERRIASIAIAGVPEVAEALGVAETRQDPSWPHFFDKTKSKRQADLVKLVAGFANPLLG
jgi:hypothetical protein